MVTEVYTLLCHIGLAESEVYHTPKIWLQVYFGRFCEAGPKPCKRVECDSVTPLARRKIRAQNKSRGTLCCR